MDRDKIVLISTAGLAAALVVEHLRIKKVLKAFNELTDAAHEVMDAVQQEVFDVKFADIVENYDE